MNIDATSVIPIPLLHKYKRRNNHQKQRANENVSLTTNVTTNAIFNHPFANCNTSTNNLSNKTNEKRAEVINWKHHPSHVFVISLLQHRGIFLPRHHTLVEYHMAELFLHYLDICRRGAYFVVYAEDKWPKEKFFRLRMLPRDWSSSSEMALPQLVCTLHDTAIDIVTSTPLTTLIGITLGIGETPAKNERVGQTSNKKEREEGGFEHFHSNKHLSVSCVTDSALTSKSKTSLQKKKQNSSSYEERHRVRPFLPFVIDKEVILGCRDGRGHRTRLLTRNAFTLWFYDKVEHRYITYDLITCDEKIYDVWVKTFRGIISVNSSIVVQLPLGQAEYSNE